MNVSQPFTIKNGASLSNAIDVSEMLYFGIQLPATFAGTSLTFQGGKSVNDTFQNIMDGNGGEVQVTCAQGQCIALAPIAVEMAPWPYIKIRSGTSASPTNQATADRTGYVVCKR